MSLKQVFCVLQVSSAIYRVCFFSQWL